MRRMPGMPLWTTVSSPDSSDATDGAPSCCSHAPSSSRAGTPALPSLGGSLGWPFLLSFTEPEDVNKNTAWFSSPGVWSTYVLIILATWLFAQATLGCDPACAWAVVNAVHFGATFYLFHWVKGSPFSEDQGLYDRLTWWEQMDGGTQHTVNRKFMLLVPVALYLVVSLATRHLPNAGALLLANTAMVFVLVIAKLPLLHRVRIFGING